jgi:hypothetical protein
MADSKREFLAAVCAAQKSDVSETRKTCTDGTLRNPKSPNLVPAPVVISRVAAPVKATHVAASSEAMHVSKDMHFVASPKAMHDSNLMGSPHMADRADTGKDPTAAVAAAEATALAGNSSSDARSVFANKAAPRMVEAQAALEVPTAGAAAVFRRSVTPLRSSHASRSGGSPHAGMTPPRSPATPVHAGSPSYEDVVAFGGIPDYSKVGLRSSSRIRAQPNADAPQMERAMEMAERRIRTPSSSQGTNCIKKLNFVNFPDGEIEHRAVALGISLGDTSDKVLSSIKAIKNLEKSRNLIFLNKSTVLAEGSGSFVLKNASNLSEDLVDEEGDDHEDLMHVPIINLRKKTKPKSWRISVRRSSRIKKLKNLSP